MWVSDPIPAEMSKWLAARDLPAIEGFLNGPWNLEPTHNIEHTLVDAAKGTCPEFQAMYPDQFMLAWKKMVTPGGGARDNVRNPVGNFIQPDTQESMLH